MNHVVRQVFTLAIIVGATIAALIALPTIAQAELPPPCASGQVQVSNGGEQAAAGHRRVLLAFSLAPDAAPCTLTGYPGVSSGAGGVPIQADWTPSGYMGGVQTEIPSAVTVSPSQPAYAVVEGSVTDAVDPYRQCPTYTDLQVIVPNTTDAVSVPASVETCWLQVHPVNAQP